MQPIAGAFQMPFKSKVSLKSSQILLAPAASHEPNISNIILPWSFPNLLYKIHFFGFFYYTPENDMDPQKWRFGSNDFVNLN